MAHRIVALMDVLGFKALVEAVPHEQLLEIYGGLQRAVRLSTTTSVYPDDHRRWDQDPYYEPAEIRRARVANVVIASDSIVVYSQGDQYTDALSVAAAVNRLLLAGFRAGVPLRGAIAIGELDELQLPNDAEPSGDWTARFDGLVGLGLVRAYEMEAGCEWSGAVLHPDLVEHLDRLDAEATALSALDVLCATRLAMEAEVPVKRQTADEQLLEVRAQRAWTLPWPLWAPWEEPRLSESEVARAFESFGRPVGAVVARKRDATLEFMRRAREYASATYDSRITRLRGPDDQ